METALSTLSTLPETREQQHNFANKMIEELMNGDHDLIKAWVQMTIIADTLEEIKKSTVLKESVLKEVEKYGKDGATINGCKATIGSRRSFDYSGCNHSGYNELKSKAEKIKEIETFLKALKSPMADPETGEIINPPSFTTSEFITVK